MELSTRNRPFYLNEDEPTYKHAIIIPYHYDKSTDQTFICLKRIKSVDS